MINKKIVHLITTLERGGAENQLLILARNQLNQGIKVEVFYLKGIPELKVKFEEAGIKVNSLLVGHSFIFQVIKFRNFIRNNSSPVHTHLPQAELIAAFSCRKRNFIISRHNFEPFWPNKTKYISRFLSRLVVSRAAGGIAISDAVKGYLLVNKEINDRFKLEVVHYGFNLEDNIPLKSSKSLLARLDSKTEFKIGTIGRLVSGKNYPTMLRAVALVVKTQPSVKFFIVGGGREEKNLLRLTKELEIENNVIWLGRTEYIKEFLSSIDLFIFASKGEGFGLVLLEAMMSYKPILAPCNSAIPEVLGSNYEGLFSTDNYTLLANRIVEVITDSTKSEFLVSDYKNQIELFDPGVMAEKVLNVYRKSGF